MAHAERNPIQPQHRHPHRRRHLQGIRPRHLPLRRRDLGAGPPRGRGDARGVRARPGARPPVLQREAERACRSDGRAERGASGAGQAGARVAGRGAGRHPEHRRPSRPRRQPQPDPHARRVEQGPVRGLWGAPGMARRSRHRRHVPLVWPRRRLEAARGLVRRDAARHRPDLRRPGCLRAVHVGRHLGQRLPGGGLRPPRQELLRRLRVELNLEPSTGASLFDEAIYGPATESVPRFVDRLLADVVAAGS